VIVRSLKGRFVTVDSASPGELTEEDFAPNSHMLMALGTFILWFGWYGFNCGSTIAMTTGLKNGIEYGFQAAVVAMNTSISAASAGLVVFLVGGFVGVDKKDRDEKGLPLFRVTPMCNGILAGLVSISAACSTVETGSAFAIGFIGGLVYMASSLALQKTKMIDDPFDAFSIHGACGAWGVMAAALFDWGKGFDMMHGQNGFRCLKNSGQSGGCKAGVGGDFVLQNFLLVVCVTAWVGVFSAIIYGVLNLAKGLRVEQWLDKPENKGCADPGLDARYHRPAKAYALDPHVVNNDKMV